ncbi:tetratricopeptide repeat protein [Thalassotalea euphylliae]|uniref:Tetratricopeptide repeat protein n=1 Tax=Thalassotalea euphylliae TaxID=1655234 RepID=A0A3E0UKA1_9GAMM|nr:tetratricopeptide repeat protein [Thalassotalea euphylliae]REL36162.1 tetratricopeptide repeat protein [Thalassotalea euphylliae]
MNTHRLVQTLQSLQRAMQARQFEFVVTEAKKLGHDFPNQPDVFHIQALALKQLGKFEESKQSFDACLALNKKQPQVLNNYANLLAANHYEYEAEQYYKDAIKIDSDYLDAHKNLAIALLNQRKLAEALTAVERAKKLAPQNTSVLTVTADIYRAQESFEQAIAQYQQVLSINPNYVNALHNLGLTYKLIEQHDHAFAYFNKARELAPQLSQIDFNLANTLFEQGKYEQAEQFYWSALNKKPNDIEVHQTLNEFYWQRNLKDKFGHSFKLAIEHFPKSIEIRHAYAEAMFEAKQYDNAEQIINSAKQVQITSQLLHTEGKIYAVREDNAKAVALLEQAIDKHFYMDLALDLINVCIVNADYQKALHYIAQAELREPNHQLLIAYKSTCWRLIGDERYHWLIDYDKFVKPYRIVAPNGYQSTDAFLEELKTVLLSMHQLDQAPLKQTLKNGTQTPGRLLHKKHPVIASLKQALTDIVSAHIDSLPDDNTHPLLSRKSPKFAFAGSWSVRLKPNGFHVNHVHPAGWLSSAFYVSLPELSSVEQPQHAGAIKFGETSMQLGEREHVAKIIQPEAGTLALFPSYAWHGTVPFQGDEHEFRLTSPFDVVPL